MNGFRERNHHLRWRRAAGGRAHCLVEVEHQNLRVGTRLTMVGGRKLSSPSTVAISTEWVEAMSTSALGTKSITKSNRPRLRHVTRDQLRTQRASNG
jgi:hypothetical protein